MSNLLEIEDLQRARMVRFCRPESRNALAADVLDAIDDAVSTLGERALIFTGVGDTFASGANLNEIAELTAETAPAFARRGQSLMTRIEQLEQQTVAAINGFCFGGALDLALVCKRRIATQDAKFAHPGASLGIITGWGGTQRLPRVIGLANSLEMFFTALPINATHARSIGLIDEISDNPLRSALKSLESV